MADIDWDHEVYTDDGKVRGREYRRETPPRLVPAIHLMRDGKPKQAEEMLLGMEPINDSERQEITALLFKLGHDVDGLDEILNSGVSDKDLDLVRESMGDPHYNLRQYPRARRIKHGIGIVFIAAVIGGYALAGWLFPGCEERRDKPKEPVPRPAPIYDARH